MQRIEEKHLLVTRWTHWVNFPVLFLMIWSGLQIYWANDVYRVGALHFFPQWVYSLLHLDHSLAQGMAIHFFLAWIFVINGILYAAFTMISGQWRQLVPDRKSLVQAIKVTLYDLGLSKEMPPQGKYNGAQKIAYTSIAVMGAGSAVTGLAIYRPIQLSWMTSLLGGYPAARTEHFLLTMAFLGFFVIHIAQVVRAGYNNFRSMVSGIELKKEEAADV